MKTMFFLNTKFLNAAQTAPIEATQTANQENARVAIRNLTLLAASLLLTACPADEKVAGTEAGTTVISEPTPGTPEAPALTTPERTICDPFNSNSPAAKDRGVVANLVWLDDTMPPRNGQPAFQSVADYLNTGNIVESTLYLDRLFIPTRAFDLGFSTLAGDQILNHLGQPMYEYFALHIEGQFQLAANEPEGQYQLTVLSDDGAVLKVDDGNDGWTTVVNNDGEHATRMACSTRTINMTRQTKLPFILDYYQGPRYHISLVVMWRPVPDGTDPDVPVNEVRCGQSGNSHFFNSAVVPTQTKAPFLELLSRGWKVLENENYAFPAQATNPCVPLEAPLSISGFQIASVTRTTATLNWTTNINSTSQVEVRNVATGAVNRTTLEPALSTDHRVTVTGLTPNTLYAFKGISTSPGGQTAVSDERALRTPR